MGRAKKPAAIKKLQGNPGKRKIPDEVEPPKGIPPCPTFLSPSAKKMWKLLGGYLDDIGLISVVDGAPLMVICSAWAELEKAEKEIQGNGEVFSYKGAFDQPMQKLNLWVPIREKARKTLLAAAKEFGLTPVSRTRVPVPKKDPAKDKWGAHDKNPLGELVVIDGGKTGARRKRRT